MEQNFWITLNSPSGITLNSPSESPDSLARSLKVQHEGAPWICVWITDVLSKVVALGEAVQCPEKTRVRFNGALSNGIVKGIPADGMGVELDDI